MSVSSIKNSMDPEQNKYKNFKPSYYHMRNFYGPMAGDKYMDIDNRTVLVESIDGIFHRAFRLYPNMIYEINTEGIVLFRGDWKNTSRLKKVLTCIMITKYS